MMGLPRLLAAGAAFALAALAGAVALPRPAAAVCSVFDHKPCSYNYHSDSVFNHHPYTPYFCGVFSGPSCTPDVYFPLNPDERRTFKFQNTGAPDGPPTTPIDNLAGMYSAIEHCWRPPRDVTRPGMEITVLITFKRSGELLGQPRITYETPKASDEERLAYRTAMAESIARCTPLPFTDGFGNAQAGRPSRIRFIDTRQQKKAEFNG